MTDGHGSERGDVVIAEAVEVAERISVKRVDAEIPENGAVADGGRFLQKVSDDGRKNILNAEEDH